MDGVVVIAGSRPFAYLFEQPGILTIRRSLVRAQVEEPYKTRT